MNYYMLNEVSMIFFPSFFAEHSLKGPGLLEVIMRDLISQRKECNKRLVVKRILKYKFN